MVNDNPVSSVTTSDSTQDQTGVNDAPINTQHVQTLPPQYGQPAFTQKKSSQSIAMMGWNIIPSIPVPNATTGQLESPSSSSKSKIVSGNKRKASDDDADDDDVNHGDEVDSTGFKPHKKHKRTRFLWKEVRKHAFLSLCVALKENDNAESFTAGWKNLTPTGLLELVSMVNKHPQFIGAHLTSAQLRSAFVRMKESFKSRCLLLEQFSGEDSATSEVKIQIKKDLKERAQYCEPHVELCERIWTSPKELQTGKQVEHICAAMQGNLPTVDRCDDIPDELTSGPKELLALQSQRKKIKTTSVNSLVACVEQFSDLFERSVSRLDAIVQRLESLSSHATACDESIPRLAPDFSLHLSRIGFSEQEYRSLAANEKASLAAGFRSMSASEFPGSQETTTSSSSGVVPL